MTTTTKRPWNVRVGERIGLYYSLPGSFRDELHTGIVQRVSKRKALFHSGSQWVFETDNSWLGRVSASRFDTVLVVR